MALIALKTAVFAPIPIASVRMATAEKPGFWRRRRSARRRSSSRRSIIGCVGKRRKETKGSV